MRNTLRQQLEKALQDVDYQKGRYNEVYAKLSRYEEKEKDKMMGLQRDYEDVKRENEKLLEIIRWHINPETAKYPFEAEKDQRINDVRNRF